MKANPWSPCLILSQKGLSLADKGYASQANRSELLGDRTDLWHPQASLH